MAIFLYLERHFLRVDVAVRVEYFRWATTGKVEMDKLIITVTADSSPKYPENPLLPAIDDTAAFTREYRDAVAAGAAICHHHGVYSVQRGSNGENTMVVDLDGFRALSEGIREGSDAIIQYGTGASVEQKLELMAQGPDMISYPFSAHDMYLDSDLRSEPFELNILHPREELLRVSRAASAGGVKLDIECFQVGAFWNIEHIRRQGGLVDPVWVTLMLGWGGGGWTPPTIDSVLYLVRNLPANVIWNTSIIDPEVAWELIPSIISLGGHVRVGWEDNPYLPDGSLARSNAELVEAAVRMAAEAGREVATPGEARRILGLGR